MSRRDDAVLERVVDAQDEGTRIDVALADWLDEPRAKAQQRIAAGEVTIGGGAATKSHRLVAGERVRVLPHAPPTAVPAPPPVAVRWQDEHLAVVAKPAGLVVHPGAGVRTGATLVDALRAAGMPLAEAGERERPGIVHRLDRGTSGLLVVAKTNAAHHALSAMFKRHEVERVYWALVDGVPDPPSATIDAPLGRSSTQRTTFAVAAGGRRAVTHYDVEEALGRVARVSVRLETGRTHQVRVHMAAVGHPVTADLAYGADRACATQLELSRPALHARRLAFTHPLTGVEVAVDEAPPADLLRALGRARDLA